jgi:hypothetical protein
MDSGPIVLSIRVEQFFGMRPSDHDQLAQLWMVADLVMSISMWVSVLV